MMKKIIELVKYQLQIYFKGSKFVMPFVAVAIFLFVLYSGDSRPVGVLTSFIISCYWVFILMVWIGLSVSSDESPIMEQIIFLRMQSNVYYYLCKMLCMIIIGFIINSICLLYPIVINLSSHGGLFERTLTISDVLNAFILLSGSSIVGGSLGSFFHPRVMKDRKLAIVLAVLATIITIAKTVIINEVPIIKLFIWILPPLDSVSRIYGQAEFFNIGKSIGLFLMILLYAIIVFSAKSFICYKRKF